MAPEDLSKEKEIERRELEGGGAPERSTARARSGACTCSAEIPSSCGGAARRSTTSPQSGCRRRSVGSFPPAATPRSPDAGRHADGRELTPTAIRNRLELVAGAALFSTAGAAIKACALTSWQGGPASGPAWRRWPCWCSCPASGAGSPPGPPSSGGLCRHRRALRAGQQAHHRRQHDLPGGDLAPLHRAAAAAAAEGARCPAAILAALAAGARHGPRPRSESGRRADRAQPGLGNILAAVSGCTSAFMMVGLRWLARDGDEAPPPRPRHVVLGTCSRSRPCCRWRFPSPARPLDWIADRVPRCVPDRCRLLPPAVRAATRWPRFGGVRC